MEAKLYNAFDKIAESNPSKWIMLAHKLDPEGSQADITQVEHKYPSDLRQQCYSYLSQVWLEKVGVEGAFEKLCGALTKCKLIKTKRQLEKLYKEVEDEPIPSTSSLNHEKHPVDTRTPCILILAEEWDNPESPFSLITRSMAEMLATKCQPKKKVFCTVLNQTKLLADSVTILYPKSIEGKIEPSQKLRAFFGAYYLPDLVDHRVDIIIGLSPLTADAVFTARNNYFSNAKVITINTCIPSEAHIWLGEMLIPKERVPQEMDMVKWAQQADIVVSAGIKVFDFYKSVLDTENPHLKYFPLSIYSCQINHLKPRSQQRSPVYAISCQSGTDVHGPVAEAVEHLSHESISHWTIYISLHSEVEQSSTSYCTFKAIPDSEEEVLSTLCESSIYIDSAGTNPMWTRGLDAISHCVPFCTIENSHLAKTLVYFEKLVDQYFVDCEDDPTNWERLIKKCLDQKLHKMIHLRENILLPKSTVENHKLIILICDHITLKIDVSLPSKSEVKIIQLLEITNNTIARDCIYQNPDPSSICRLIQDVIDKSGKVNILTVKQPESIRLALVATEKQYLDEFFERSKTAEFNTNIGNVILSQAYAQEWMINNKVDIEDITFTTDIDEDEYGRYKMTLDKPDSNTHVTDQPDIDTHVIDQPDGDTHVTSKPDKNTHVTDKLDGDTHVEGQQGADTQVTSQSDEDTSHVIGQPDTHVTDLPDGDTYVISQPDEDIHVEGQPDGDTHVTSQPDRNTRVTDQPDGDGDTHVTDKLDGDTHVTGQPEGGTQVTSQPDEDINVTCQPDGDTHVTSQPERNTRVTDKPDGDGDTHVTSQPDKDTHVTGKPDGDTHVTDQPDGDAHVTGKPDRDTHVTGQPDEDTNVSGQPEGDTYVTDQPDGGTHELEEDEPVTYQPVKYQPFWDREVIDLDGYAYAIGQSDGDKNSTDQIYQDTQVERQPDGDKRVKVQQDKHTDITGPVDEDAYVTGQLDDAIQKVPGHQDEEMQVIVNISENDYQEDVAIIQQKDKIKRLRLRHGTDAAHPDIANHLVILGNIYYTNKQYREARQYDEESVVMYKKLYGKEGVNVNLALSLFNLGFSYSNTGIHDMAKKALEESVSIYKKLYGKDGVNANLALPLLTLGTTYSRLDLHDMARRTLEESVAMYRKLYNKDGDEANLALPLLNLGTTYSRLDLHDLARKTQEESVAMYRKLYGKDGVDVNLALSLGNLGATYSRLHLHDVARKTQVESVAMYRKLYGKEVNLHYSFSLHNLGYTYYHVGQYDDAARTHFTAYKMMKNLLGPDSNNQQILNSLKELIIAYRKIGRIEDVKHYQHL